MEMCHKSSHNSDNLEHEGQETTIKFSDRKNNCLQIIKLFLILYLSLAIWKEHSGKKITSFKEIKKFIYMQPMNHSNIRVK